MHTVTVVGKQHSSVAVLHWRRKVGLVEVEQAGVMNQRRCHTSGKTSHLLYWVRHTDYRMLHSCLHTISPYCHECNKS